MGLELITEADYVLNSCGRPVAPEGYKFVDLPRIIPFQFDTPKALEAPNPPPSQLRLTNSSNTLFICKGIGVKNNSVPWRIKWPNGRFFSQNPARGGNQISAGPQGVGGALLTLNNPVPIERGARVSVEQSGGFSSSSLKLELWGCIRYLLKEGAAGVEGGGAGTGVSCIVGYPTIAKERPGVLGKYSVEMMADPIEALKLIPRYACGPNQNIMAPEFLLGDSPSPGEVPAGYVDESFTFFSDPIVVGTGATNPTENFGNAVIAPGHDDVVLKRWRPVSVWSGGLVDGTPLVGMRLPNGYSITGGDLVPAVFNWMPFFPSIRLAAGTRLIVDLGQNDSTGNGTITTIIEFDAVKRRKVA